jgi:hypothetical protein
MTRILSKSDEQIGQAYIEFFEHEDAPNEAVIVITRGGVSESQLTRKELLALASLAIAAANKLRPS